MVVKFVETICWEDVCFDKGISSTWTTVERKKKVMMEEYAYDEEVAEGKKDYPMSH